MNGATVYQMISGLGDAFGDAYATARKDAQEAEAPSLLSNLMTAYRGGATGPTAPSTPAGPTASGLGAHEATDAAPRTPTFVGLSGANPSSAKKMSGTNADFVTAMMPHALEASKATGIDPRIILAQSAIETGYGRSAPGNNYFGIKSHGQPGGNTMATTEVVNGQPVRVSDSFRAFPSMGDSAAGYADFINRNPRYAGLKAAQGLDGQAAALQASGYATDPHYGAKVLQIAKGLPAPAGAAADAPAPGAMPVGFTIPEGGTAAPSQSFPGFSASGAGGSRMTPEMQSALNAAWKNPNTRAVAAQVFGQLLQGKDAGWELKDVNGQSAWVNGRDGRILPIGQPKRNTATVGNSLVDQNTGEVIYTGPDKDSSKLQSVAQGTTLYDPVTRQPVFTAPRAERDEGDKVRDQVAAREAEAERLGLPKGSPTAQTYALTGKIGRDQELSATDKKAIMEADEAVLSAQTAIDSLNQAKSISPKAYVGPTAGMRGYGMSLVGSEAGEATQDLSNIVTTNTLGQLKAIFGGNPTEGERKILLDIQGSVSQPDAVRQKIFDRGIALAQRRLEFNRKRAEDLKGGTFYKADGAAPASGSAPLPKGADRVTIPGGKSAAAAVSEARAFVTANPGAKAQVQERLRSWGIDPARLD